MKKIGTISSLIFIFGSIITPVSAKKKRVDKNEISLGYGVWPKEFYELSNLYYDLFRSLLTFKRVSSENLKPLGIINIGYKRAVARKVMPGGVLAYEYITADLHIDDQPAGERKTSFYKVAAELEYHYISTNFFKMYCGIGAGYIFSNRKIIITSPISEVKKERSTTPSLYLNYLGFKIGTPISFFIAFGYGYKGLLNAGYILSVLTTCSTCVCQCYTAILQNHKGLSLSSLFKSLL